MQNSTDSTFFSSPFTSQDEAQASAPVELMKQYGVFQTPEGSFVFGELRTQLHPEKVAVCATGIKQLIGYELVSYQVPLVLNWKLYKEPDKSSDLNTEK